MGFENKAGLGVNNHYGVRSTGGSVGVETSDNSVHQLRIDLTGQSIADAVAGFVPPVLIKKGTLFRKAILRVDEVFVVTGTTPNLEIGSAGSTATNGIALTEAKLEALGTSDVSAALVGTWATASTTGVAADAKVAMALEGDTAIAATSGKATLILEFSYVTKV